jgi:ribosomal protein S18 acetylase RimI-like enzyme
VRTGARAGRCLCRRVPRVEHSVGMTEILVLTPDDWQLWRELRLAALADAPGAFSSRLADWQGAGDREERWRARLAIPGSHNVVAARDGEPVGMASGLPSGQPGVAELASMWVRPDARGQGVGSELVASVEAWARQAGASQLRLGVAEGNEPAIALYRRHGFAATGEIGDLLPSGYREQIMVKPLSGPASSPGLAG